METKKKDDRKLLGSQIEDRILEYIKEKPLEVGDRLPNEFELAEMFEVGRSTIREAVKGLVTKGVLQVRRGAGTYVSSLTPAEDDPLRLNAKLHDRFKLALDLFDVRLILEPEIAAKAAVYATDEDIATLKGQKKRCARNHAVLKELPDGKGINQKNEDGKDSDNHESLKVGRPPGKRCRREASRFPSGRRIVALVVEDVIQDFDEVSHSTHLFEVVGGDVSVADEGAQLYEKIHCVNRVEIQVVV